ncbi:hypothetical protein [Undibacterium parvum]|nr:hypothetical protein [Undibacterium parvum]
MTAPTPALVTSYAVPTTAVPSETVVDAATPAIAITVQPFSDKLHISSAI